MTRRTMLPVITFVCIFRMSLKCFRQVTLMFPMFIHDTTPPGVPTMTKLHNEIHYHYHQTDSGGNIMIDTANPKALEAVHEFLRFQITEHKTGDPTEVTK
jgi:hypothetical protein